MVDKGNTKHVSEDREQVDVVLHDSDLEDEGMKSRQEISQIKETNLQENGDTIVPEKEKDNERLLERPNVQETQVFNEMDIKLGDPNVVDPAIKDLAGFKGIN